MTRRIRAESDMNVSEYGINKEGSQNKISVRINSDPDEFVWHSPFTIDNSTIKLDGRHAFTIALSELILMP